MTHRTAACTVSLPCIPSTVAVVIIDAVGTIMVVSPGVSDLFGYQRTELETQNVAMLMPPVGVRPVVSYLGAWRACLLSWPVAL